MDGEYFEACVLTDEPIEDSELLSLGREAIQQGIATHGWRQPPLVISRLSENLHLTHWYQYALKAPMIKGDRSTSPLKPWGDPASVDEIFTTHLLDHFNTSEFATPLQAKEAPAAQGTVINWFKILPQACGTVSD